MGFFGKIKQMLGIGTVKVKLNMGDSFDSSANVLTGTIQVIGKSDQIAKDIQIEFKETVTTGKNDNKTTKHYDLGSLTLPGFEIKKDQTLDFPFELTYVYGKTTNEAMADKGGLVGGLGKLGAMMDNEKHDYQVTATVHLEGVKISPMDIKTIKKAKK